MFSFTSVWKDGDANYHYGFRYRDEHTPPESGRGNFSDVSFIQIHEWNKKESEKNEKHYHVMLRGMFLSDAVVKQVNEVWICENIKPKTMFHSSKQKLMFNVALYLMEKAKYAMTKGLHTIDPDDATDKLHDEIGELRIKYNAAVSQIRSMVASPGYPAKRIFEEMFHNYPESISQKMKEEWFGGPSCWDSISKDKEIDHDKTK